LGRIKSGQILEETALHGHSVVHHPSTDYLCIEPHDIHIDLVRALHWSIYLLHIPLIGVSGSSYKNHILILPMLNVFGVLVQDPMSKDLPSDSRHNALEC